MASDRFLVQLDDESEAALDKIREYLHTTKRPPAIRWALIEAARMIARREAAEMDAAPPRPKKRGRKKPR